MKARDAGNGDAYRFKITQVKSTKWLSDSFEIALSKLTRLLVQDMRG